MKTRAWLRSLGLMVSMTACNGGDMQADKSGTDDATTDMVTTGMATTDMATTGDSNTSGGGGGGMCDPWVQDCPEGTKCAPYNSDNMGIWDENHCVPLASDPKLPGDSCTMEDNKFSGQDNCAVGSMCFDVDANTLKGVCVEMCTGSPNSPECSDIADVCTIFPPLILCLPGCHPLMPGCADGEVCVPLQSDFICVYTPFPPMEPGAECTDHVQCGPGNFCTDATHVPGCATGKCCTEFCDLKAPACSLAMQTCVPYFKAGEAPAGKENIGLCGAPV